MQNASIFSLCIVCSLGKVEEQIDTKKEGMQRWREPFRKRVNDFPSLVN